MAIEWEKVEYGVSEGIEDMPENAKIISVDGREVEGRCECCESLLFYGENNHFDIEGIGFCESCYKDWKEEERRNCVVGLDG